jgi:hypothetical protein
MSYQFRKQVTDLLQEAMPGPSAVSDGEKDPQNGPKTTCE